MEVVIVPDSATIGALAADAVVALLARKPTAVLGLATGSSPLVVYAELIRRHRAGDVSFAQSRGFLLDEYVGLPAEHPQRYRSVIRTELEQDVDFAADAVRGPDGLADDLPAECTRVRASHCRRRRCRPAAARRRVGRTRRVQRARLVAELTDADQDPDRPHSF